MRSSLLRLEPHYAPPTEAVTHRLTDPCGKFLPALVYHDLRDRLRGHRHRANARWGVIDRPNAPGKLVWVVAGASRESVRLGVELARAILARRLDISLTLTFEHEYPELLAPLGASNRLAWGYAPADYAGSMHAVWRRLLPFAIILAGTAPRPNLLRLCEACRHAVLVAPPASISGRYERIYPAHGTAHDGANVAPAADLDVLLVPGRAGSEFGRLADASAGRGLYLWHGDDVDAAKRLYALFRGHLPDEIMLVSGPACTGLAEYAAETVRLGTWSGEPLTPDKLVLVDDPSLLPLMAADLRAAHFDLPAWDAAWQALAAGALVSAVESARLSAPSARAVLRSAADENGLVADWARLAADATLRKATSSASRAAYAAERELAYATVTELLDRVCAWR